VARKPALVPARRRGGTAASPVEKSGRGVSTAPGRKLPKVEDARMSKPAKKKQPASRPAQSAKSATPAVPDRRKRAERATPAIPVTPGSTRRTARTNSKAEPAAAEKSKPAIKGDKPVSSSPNGPVTTASFTSPTTDSKSRGRSRRSPESDDIDDVDLVIAPGIDSVLAEKAIRTRRPVAAEPEDGLPNSSYFDLLLEKPAGEDPDDLDGADSLDDESDAELLEALSNPTPMPGRWNPEVQLTSADYNDRNQELFARRNELLASVTTMEAKRRPTRDDVDRLRRTRHELDTVTHEIVSFNYGLVLNYTRKFTSTTSKDDSADFEAAGVVGLMRAVKSYNPGYGTKFSTWAYKPIQREILKAVRDADFKQLNPGDFEKRPEILRAVKALQNGNEEFVPTFEAVAVQAGATLDAVKRILNAPIIDSLSAPMGEDGDTSLTDMIEDPAAGVEDTALARQEILDLERFGLSCLDERELFVIGRRFGLDGEPPQRLSAIGTLLGLSREAVRQVEAKALSKLLHPVTRRRLIRHGRR
jgi:RNA polymerase sigma factor (sigma-70 family)